MFHEPFLNEITCDYLNYLKKKLRLPLGDVVRTSVNVTPAQPTRKMACSTTVSLISTPTHAPGGRAPVYNGP